MNHVSSLKLFALLHSQHFIFTLIKFFLLSSLCFIYKSPYLIVDTVSFVLYIPRFPRSGISYIQRNIEYIGMKGKTISLLGYGPAEIILKCLTRRITKVNNCPD